MPDPIITYNSTKTSIIWEPVFGDDNVVTFAGPGTLLAGTILARIAATGALTPFVVGGDPANEGTPKAILLHELTATGAGDLPVRPIIGGRVRLDKLVIAADGDASNVDKAVQDQLRGFGMVVLSTQQLAEYDNPNTP